MKTTIAITTILAIAVFASGVERWKSHGAISCFGNSWGGVVTNTHKESVQYWLGVQLWKNVEDRTARPVQPRDVVIFSAQEPVVIKTNGQWEIRFKE